MAALIMSYILKKWNLYLKFMVNSLPLTQNRMSELSSVFTIWSNSDYWSTYHVAGTHPRALHAFTIALYRSYVCAQLLTHVQLFCNPMSCSLRGFSRQEYWSGVPFPTPWAISHPCLNFTWQEKGAKKLKTFLKSVSVSGRNQACSPAPLSPSFILQVMQATYNLLRPWRTLKTHS